MGTESLNEKYMETEKQEQVHKAILNNETDIGFKYEYMQMMKLEKDDFTMKCIPFRVF